MSAEIALRRKSSIARNATASTVSKSGSVSNVEVVRKLGDRVLETLRPLLSAHRRFAMIDYPAHSNVGDSAIWVGQIAALRKLDLPAPQYCCTTENYSRQELSRQVGKGAILIHGGGNFGDLWEDHQNFREEVIQSFPDNPIIQFPQSIYFTDRARLLRTRKIINAHPRFTLCVRDQYSYDLAREEFTVPVMLCPDMAFVLGSLPRSAPTERVVFLTRTDKEAVPGESIPGMPRTDWIGESPTLLSQFNTKLGQAYCQRPRMLRAFRGLLNATYNALAQQRLRRGCRILCRGENVITDRLHGHILSMLLGIPNVALDNSYGKVHGYINAWSHCSDLVQKCRTEAEAIKLLSR